MQAVDLWQKDSYSVLATKLKFFIVTFCIFLLLIIFKSGAFYDIGGRRSRLMVSRCVLLPFESTLPRISWSVYTPVHHIHSTKSYKINGLTLISCKTVVSLRLSRPICMIACFSKEFDWNFTINNKLFEITGLPIFLPHGVSLTNRKHSLFLLFFIIRWLPCKRGQLKFLTQWFKIILCIFKRELLPTSFPAVWPTLDCKICYLI